MRVSQMARTHIMHCIQIMGVHGTWRSDLRPRLELELRVRDAIGRED